jgi:hypothetical protein
MDHYNKLSYQEIEKLVDYIDKGMRTMNGDTTMIPLTARQVAILLWTYAKRTRPMPGAYIFADIQCMLREGQLSNISPDERSPFE